MDSWKKTTSNLNSPTYNEVDVDIIPADINGVQEQVDPVPAPPIQSTPVESPGPSKEYATLEPLQQFDLETTSPKPPTTITTATDEEKPVNLEPEDDQEPETGGELVDNCVLRENLEKCDLYMCRVIRSVLALPFPHCYAATNTVV